MQNFCNTSPIPFAAAPAVCALPFRREIFAVRRRRCAVAVGKTLSPRCDAEVEAAVNLLMYKPKKLSVYSDEEVSADFKKVADMFDTRYLCGEV